MKARVFIAMVLVAMLFMSAAMQTSFAESSDAPSKASGKVVFWHWDTATHEKVAQAYNRLVNPDVAIEMVAVNYPDYMTKLQIALVGGLEMPDIIAGELGFRAQLYRMDILDDLEQAPYNLDRSTINEYIIPVIEHSGKIVGVDDSISATGLAYKAELAKEYLGTDDPAEIEKMFPTWDALIEKGREVYETSGGTVYILSSWSDAMWYYNNGYKPSLVTENGKPTNYLLNELPTERYAKLTAMLKNHTFDPAMGVTRNASSQASYARNNQIFYLCAMWSPTFEINPNDPNAAGRWRLANLPGGAINNGGTTFGIYKDSKNKEAAWDFLKWSKLSETGCQEVLKETGNFSNYKPFIDSFDYTSVNDSLTNKIFASQNAIEKFVVDLAPQIQLRPLDIYQSQINTAFQIAEEAVITNPDTTFKQYKDILINEIKATCPDLAW